MELKPLTSEEIKSVKPLGFLHNRGTRKFSSRVVSRNGILTSEQVKIVADAAEKFGDGKVTFTTRLNIEVPGIEFENIDNFRKLIETAGLITGGTGAKVRPVVACKGSTCVFGLYDTAETAKEIHDDFFVKYNNVKLPHKFKITVGGCPNNCAKPSLNDVGLMGQRVLIYDYDKCKGCSKCGVETACPMKAASVKDGKLNIDYSLCTKCGRCLSKCPFKVAENYNDRIKLIVGGKWGKTHRLGTPLETLLTKEETMKALESAILLYKSKGKTGERFANLVETLGIEEIERLLLSNELLDNKEAILAAN